MTAKSSTFAGQLKHFAQSVDIVDDNTFDQIRDLICKYVTNEMNGEYFELLRAESAGDGARRPWLRTFWSSEEKMHLWPVRSSDGSYANPVTAVFDAETPMWITNPEKKPLGQADECEDQWSRAEHPSGYRPSSAQPIRTVIIVPLSFQQVIGAYCIESSQYIEITDVAKLELSRLADALAILYTLWEANKAHAACKEHAISDLRDLLHRARFPKLAKPHVFIAFSNRADETVKLAIKDALDEFSDKLEFTDWTEMDESGNITAQIGKEILESRFGICYLSEPLDHNGDGGHDYGDNPNVVFEAGMLHARTSTAADKDEGQPTGWIPIREAESPPPPFDFAAERILYVPRSATGQLNESKFRDLLAKRIARLLQEG